MLPDSLPGIFIFSFLIALGAVISPGPVSAAIVSQAPRHGWLTGPLVATGHSLIELVLISLILIGLSTFLAHLAIQITIAILGGLFLLWMGTQMILGSLRGRLGLPEKDLPAARLNAKQLIQLGFLATISNPFWYAWWVTVAAGYLSEARLAGVAAVVAFFTGHITADYAWDTVLSAAVGGGRRWMTNTVYLGINLATGLFLLYIGFSFLHNAFRLLSG